MLITVLSRFYLVCPRVPGPLIFLHAALKNWEWPRDKTIATCDMHVCNQTYSTCTVEHVFPVKGVTIDLRTLDVPMCYWISMDSLSTVP